MTPLERRCRRLLLAYPAAYRRERGEEMIGTLLEATPDGRTWPLQRDCRAMLVGGLQVRAAQNHRLSTLASLRLAAMLGCVLYLSFEFYSLAGILLWQLGARLGLLTQSYLQLAFAAGLLACTAVVVVRPGGRKGAIAATVAAVAVIAGAAAVVIVSLSAAAGIARVLAELLTLAVLALLSRRGERLPWLWLWLPGLAVAAALLAPVASSLRFPHYFALLLAQPTSLYVWAPVTFLALAWIVIDARPAVGIAIFLGMTAAVRLISTWLTIRQLRFVTVHVGPASSVMMRTPAAQAFVSRALLGGAWSLAWKLLATGLVLAVVSSWRLRRQAAL